MTYFALASTLLPQSALARWQRPLFFLSRVLLPLFILYWASLAHSSFVEIKPGLTPVVQALSTGFREGRIVNFKRTEVAMSSSEERLDDREGALAVNAIQLFRPFVRNAAPFLGRRKESRTKIWHSAHPRGPPSPQVFVI